LEHIIIPIAVFVVTTADPPEKIELVQQDIFHCIVMISDNKYHIKKETKESDIVSD
jgi:hypothetical protein